MLDVDLMMLTVALIAFGALITAWMVLPDAGAAEPLLVPPARTSETA